MTPDPIVLRTLGAAQVDTGRVQVRPNAWRRFAALLYLSAEAGRRVPRRVLIDLLYPEQTERNGLHSLRELVYQLKSAGVGLDADQEGIELPAEAVRADYAEMLRSDRLTLEQIRAAQGGFLPGYVPHQSEAYKEWFEPFRAKTVFGLSQVLLRDQARARDVGNLELSEAAARGCLAVSPLNEYAVRALAETLVLGGAKSDAVRLLDAYEAEVGGLAPELKLSAELLKQRIRERVPSLYRADGELPFAGRDAEMCELRRLLAQSKAGSSHAVLISGDPGIGKTRLITEFAALAQFDGTSVQRVTAHPKANDRPMGVLIDLLPRLLELPGALGVSPESMQALRRLTCDSQESGVGSGVDHASEVISRAIGHAFTDLISAISAETHLAIIVDDSQWADRVSLDLLFDLITNEDSCLLLVMTTREGHPTVGQFLAGDTSVMQLRALDRDCVLQLSKRCLRGTTAERDEELQVWMARIAQGNPLFLESLVAHYKSTGELFTVPSSLRDLLARRLSALRGSSMAVLQVCVLLGALSTEKRLLACLEMRFVELLEGLNELHQLRLVDCDAGRILPAHPLIAEVLQVASDDAVLRLIHRKIAMMLELEPRARDSATLLWESAHHWASAGEHDRALENFRKCADHAQSIGRPADAAALLLRAAQLQLTDAACIEVLRDAVLSAQRAGEFDLVLDGVNAIRRLNPTMAHDDIELAEFAAMSVVYVDSADFSNRVLGCLRSADADSNHRVRVGLAALKYADTYSVPSLARLVAQAVSETDLSAVEELVQLEFRMVCQAASGEPELTVPYARQLHAIAAALPPAAAVGAVLNAGHAYWRAGLLQESCAALRLAYELAGQCGAVRRQVAAAMHLAVIACDQGENQSAELWRQAIHELQKSSARDIGEFTFALFQLDFAFIDADLRRAEVILAAADKRGLFSSAIRLRWRRYIDARMRQLADPRAISGRELAAFLLDCSDAASTSGIREAEIAVICVALVAQGRIDEARERLLDFLCWHSRYSRAPIPRQLQQVVFESGVGDLLSEDIAPAIRKSVSGRQPSVRI